MTTTNITHRELSSSLLVNGSLTRRDYPVGMPRKRRPTDQVMLTGLRLRAAREAMDDMKQGAIAASVGVSQNTWSMWENGHRPADAFAVARFCNRYGATMDWVYRGSMVGLPASLRQKIASRYQRIMKESGDAAETG